MTLKDPSKMDMTEEARLGFADLHMHTTVSDGGSTVQELMRFVADQRPHLDVIAITDHDRLDASLWAYEHRDEYPFEVIPGLEVSSLGGHILALWVTTPIPRGMSLSETSVAIREAGGYSVLAHPFHWHMGIVRENSRQYRTHPETILEAGINGLEVHNAGVITPYSNKLARKVGNQIGIAVLGNSDAHTLGAIGSGVTRFSGSSAEELEIALENKETIAEGKPWPIRDFAAYVRNTLTQKENQYSAVTP